MSVVNKVLRDLDARHAGERSGMPSAVTPLNVILSSRSAGIKPLVIVALLALIVGAGVWYWFKVLKVAREADAAEMADAPASSPAVAKPQAISPPPVLAAVNSTVAPAAPAASVAVPVVTPVAAPVATESAPPPVAPAQADTPPAPIEKTAAPRGKATAPPASSQASGHYLQLGAFGVQANADGLVQKLQTELAGSGDWAKKLVTRPNGRLTLVQLGPWPDAAAARKVKEQLKSQFGVGSELVMTPLKAPSTESALDPPAPANPPHVDPVAAAPSPAKSSSKAAKLGRASPSAPAQAVPAVPAVVSPVAAPEMPSVDPAVPVTNPAPVASARNKSSKATPTHTPMPNEGMIDKSSPRQLTPVERAEATYRRALLIQRQGQLDDAAALFRAALEDNIEHAAARQTLAGMLIDAKHYDEAEDVLRKGVDIESVRLPSVLALARLKVERNQAPAALDLLQKNARAGERSADYQGFLGALLNRLGKHRDAIGHYQMATQLAPTEGRWWAALGIAYEAQGQTSDAKEAYKKAQSLPGLPPELAQHIEQRLR